MRLLNVRLRNQTDVDKLSKKLGVDVTKATLIELFAYPENAFGKKHSCRVIKRREHNLPENKLDISLYDWDGMPPYKSRIVRDFCHFKIRTNMSSDDLSTLFFQQIKEKTKSIWYPRLQRRPLTLKLWRSRIKVSPCYPIYIISKGRWDNCLTPKTLDFMDLDYRIVVEPAEVLKYKRFWGDKVITGDFDTTTRSSIPVRNWIDDNCEAEKYWLLDDNINYFYIMNDNCSWRTNSGAVFKLIEEFSERYENVALAGMNKLGFCTPKDKVAPYVLNTRVYSITLLTKAMNDKIKIDGKLWRGRYNEDTDLNIRFLKAGYCTMNFQMFLGDKATTMRMKGGNTDSVYVDGDGRKKFAQSLVDQHPDVAKVVERYGRFHHHVDWSVFKKNKLIKKSSYPVRDYGLFLDDY